MGFDPRNWSSPFQSPQRVTCNVEALLAENEALRRELQQLRQRLQLLERQRRGAGARSWSDRDVAGQQQPPPPPPPPPPRVSAEQVQRWGETLAAQSGWRDLRLGCEASGLRGLIETLNRRSFNPLLTLEQRLERLMPGLGRDLEQALAGPVSRKRLAIRAAFALYGVSAAEWLDDEPQRVVAELRARQRHDAGRRTSSDRSDQRRTAPGGGRASSQARQDQRASAADAGVAGAPAGADPRRLEAYRVLGLQWGASHQAIKLAHRRLVKQHHPDMGGQAEDFHRISQAYQLLVA